LLLEFNIGFARNVLVGFIDRFRWWFRLFQVLKHVLLIDALTREVVVLELILGARLTKDLEPEYSGYVNMAAFVGVQIRISFEQYIAMAFATEPGPIQITHEVALRKVHLLASRTIDLHSLLSKITTLTNRKHPLAVARDPLTAPKLSSQVLAPQLL
jgi:hypothetical protein